MACAHTVVAHVPPHVLHADSDVSDFVHVLASFHVPPQVEHDSVHTPYGSHVPLVSLVAWSLSHLAPLSAWHSDWLMHWRSLLVPQVIVLVHTPPDSARQSSTNSHASLLPSPHVLLLHVPHAPLHLPASTSLPVQPEALEAEVSHAIVAPHVPSGAVSRTARVVCHVLPQMVHVGSSWPSHHVVVVHEPPLQELQSASFASDSHPLPLHLHRLQSASFSASLTHVARLECPPVHLSFFPELPMMQNPPVADPLRPWVVPVHVVATSTHESVVSGQVSPLGQSPSSEHDVLKVVEHLPATHGQSLSAVHILSVSTLQRFEHVPLTPG